MNALSRVCLFIGVFSFVFSLAAEEKTPQWNRPLKQITPHVYAYVGTNNACAANSYAANAGVIIGNDAVMVVDTLISAKEGRKLLEDIKTVTDKPVKYVVNTHYHLDHALGNCEFVKQGAIVIAQERVKESFERAGEIIKNPEARGMTRADIEGTVLLAPNIYFSDRIFIDLGGITVALIYTLLV